MKYLCPIIAFLLIGFASNLSWADDDHPQENDHHESQHENEGGPGVGGGVTLDLNKLTQKKKEPDPFDVPGTQDKKTGEEEPPKGHTPPPETINVNTDEGKPKLSTPDEQLWPKVVDIHPVQVVQDPPHEVVNEDVPLVVEKSTMVRVFVKLPEDMGECGAECKLSWNGKEVGDIKGDLIKDYIHDRTLVIAEQDKEKASAKRYLKALEWQSPTDPQTLEEIGDLYWAFNFTFKDGKLMPPHLELRADLYVNGALVSSMHEADQKTAQQKPTFKIKPFDFHDDLFHLVVGAYSVKSKPKFVTNYKRLHPDPTEEEMTRFLRAYLTKQAEGYEQELLAVYPIPDNNVATMIRAKLDPDADMRENLVVVPAPGIGGSWRLLSGGDPVTGEFPDAVDGDARTPLWSDTRTYSAKIREQYPTADAIVIVTTHGYKVAGVSAEVEGWTPGGIEGVHYIDEYYDPPDELSVAHEIGHQTRFLGTLHWFSTFTAHPVTLGDLQDGWNAGQHIGDMNTAIHSYELMADGKTEGGHRRFITLKEYKKLLNVMVQGGADPLLLDVNGILSPDGKLSLMPMHLSMGQAPEAIPGPGTLVFTNAAGKKVGAWNFPLVTAEPGPAWQQFATQAPVPDNTASVTLQLPGGVLQKFDFPKSQPEIDWHDVRYDPVKEVLHATFTLKGDSAKPYLASFACQSDNHGLVDLPDAQSRLSPGDHTVDLSLSDVPQSNHAKIMLTVSKDLSFAQAISSEFSLPNHPPEAYIDPVFNEDKVEGLHSIIYDLEDQFHLKTAWSEAAKTLETGRDLTLQQLKGLGEGKHDIVLTVTDSDGKISTDHLLLRITHDGNVELVKPSHLLAWVLKFVLPGTLLLAAAAIILYRLKKRGAPM